jgi:hypothetical protein
MLRSPDLQLFLTMAEAAIRHGSGVDGPARAASDRIFAALQTPSVEPITKRGQYRCLVAS